jgi:signal transduction histidine kinase
MKPLLLKDRDAAALQDLGRASLQILHDIKNQLNGLKLYATYLRKRLERLEEAADLQDPLAKLIGGLDRFANDLGVLERYGRPLSLKRHPGVDLQKLMRGVSANLAEIASGDANWALVVDSDPVTLVGAFDATALIEAFKAIAIGVFRNNPEALRVSLRRDVIAAIPTAIIEWRSVDFSSGDPFRSFNGSEGIRMSLAAKIVEAHGGSVETKAHMLWVRLPLTN